MIQASLSKNHTVRIHTQQRRRVAVTLEDKVPYVSYDFYKAKALQTYRASHIYSIYNFVLSV